VECLDGAIRKAAVGERRRRGWARSKKWALATFELTGTMVHPLGRLRCLLEIIEGKRLEPSQAREDLGNGGGESVVVCEEAREVMEVEVE